MLASYRAASRQTYVGSETYLTVAGFGPSWWSLLDRADQVGLALVAGPGVGSVRVHPEPVTLELDVNAAPGADAHVRLGVQAGGEWFSASELDVLGEAGHGVALWMPTDHPETWALTLAPLAVPAGPEVRRLLAAGDTMRIPVDDLDDLVAEYLPRLQRHLPVSSSDGSVVLPEPAVPRLAVTVTWVSVDEVHLAWSWRYRQGADDRVYALGESRGLAGFRRLDLERHALDALELGDEAVHRLYDSHRRDHGPVPLRTFDGVAAIAFADDVLPDLEAEAAGGRLELSEIGGRPDYREARDAPVVRFAARGTDAASGEDAGRTDWLDLEVVITVDGDALALANLLEALTRGQDRVILRTGVHIAVDRPEFRHLAELVDRGRRVARAAGWRCPRLAP